MNDQEKNLRDLFARLFRRENQIDRLLSDAGIDASVIDLNGSALDQWHNIFVYAGFRKKSRVLVEKALALFPENEQLRQASEDALREVRGPEIPQPKNIPAEVLERITAGKNTLLPIHFLRGGLEAAKSVARVLRADGGSGTGFLLPGNWFLTNHHVLSTVEDAATARAQFDFERMANGLFTASREFDFDPAAGFHTSPVKDGDDWTAVKMKTDVNSLYGAIILTDVDVKKGEFVNIIQHAGGGPKQIALYHNTVIDGPERRLRYLTDTEPGSSGSPVFNSKWQVVALHHSAAQGVDEATDASIICNEGIHINVLMKILREIGICQ